MKTTGQIKDSRMAESLMVLRDFVKIARDFGVDKIIAVGTQALREAKNSERFLDMVRKELGFYIKVISPEEEALLTIEGIKAGLDLQLPIPETIIAFDLGGGSTEFIIMTEENTKFFSVPLGVLKLSHLIGVYPPSINEIDAIRGFVRNSIMKESELKELSFQLPSPLDFPEKTVEFLRTPVVIGTGGTVTTIGSMDLALKTYEPDRIHGHRIPLVRLKELLKKLCSLSLEEIKRVGGLEPRREDIILPGIITVVEILDLFSVSTLIISDYGVLEGIIRYEEL